MIPINEIQIVNNGQPQDVGSFAATSRISELEFRRGSLHIRHTKETVWPSVMIETAQQQATFWILAQIGGQWVAAGMERLRPNQQDKPEGDDPAGFITGFVEGRNFGAFNGHHFNEGDRLGFMVVQGNTRLAQDAPLRERSLVVEMAFPPNGQILWTEGETQPQPTPNIPDAAVPQPPPNVPYGDIQDVLSVVRRMEIKLELLATKKDIADARQQFVDAVKQFGPVLERFARIFGR